MHKHYMQLALQEAQKGIYFTKPNPAVGCAIVKNNQVIATGYHAGFGHDHAEIDALKKINFDASDCELYVTLEPCAHFGQTPPCVDAIINSGVKRVIAPFVDPNPLTKSLGFNRLRQHGIEVIQNIEQQSCYDINRFFMHFMQTKRPYIIAKWAMTAKTELTVPDQQWISGEPSRAHTHLLRQRADAIMVGANTLRQDNPKLTTRVAHIPSEQHRHPLRIVLTHCGDFDLNSLLFSDEHTHNTLIACTDIPNPSLVTHCRRASINLLLLSGNTDVEKLNFLLNYLAQQKVSSIVIEGGKMLLKTFLKHNLVDEIQCYISDKNAKLDVISSFVNLSHYILREHQVIGNDVFYRINKEYCYV